MWKVLLVEDEEDALHYTKNLVDWNRLGFEVVGEAKDGSEALQRIRELQPDAVITDIVMLPVDGLELLRTAREQGCDARFVMLTCMGEFEYARQALEHGASSYLLKLSMNRQSLEQTMTKVAAELSDRAQLHQVRRVEESGLLLSMPARTDHTTINKVLEFIRTRYEEEISLRTIAEYVSMDRSYLSDLFRIKTGYTLTYYLHCIRIEEAKRLLVSDLGMAISEICYRVGFNNENYFNKVFKRITELTPGEYRKLHKK
jgi:two-component system response regulator YesN